MEHFRWHGKMCGAFNACNCVHFNIKQKNYLVDANQRVKLGDFGIAIDLSKISTLPDQD